MKNFLATVFFLSIFNILNGEEKSPPCIRLVEIVRDEIISKGILSLSDPIAPTKVVAGLPYVSFPTKLIAFAKDKDDNFLYRLDALGVEHAKEIRRGDFEGHYRFAKMKDGSFMAFYHHGNYGDDQYLVCYCDEIDGSLRITCRVLVSGLCVMHETTRRRPVVVKLMAKDE